MIGISSLNNLTKVQHTFLFLCNHYPRHIVVGRLFLFLLNVLYFITKHMRNAVKLHSSYSVSIFVFVLTFCTFVLRFMTVMEVLR